MTAFTSHDFAHDDLGHGSHAIDLDGQVHGFEPSVAEVLIERQLLYLDREKVWRLRTHGFPDLSADAPLGYVAICDFCGARPTTWNIPCETFALPRLPLMPLAMSAGDWAACETCGGHIAENRQAAFLAHCLKAHDRPQAPHQLRWTLKHYQELTHREFWRHYRGGAIRTPARPFGH
jgi:hypothetical protein